MEFLQIAATVVSAISALSKGGAESNRYKAQQQAYDYNAAVTRQRAESTRLVAGQREEQQRRESRIIQGKQRALIAQSGTGLGGSNADIENQSMMFEELDALNIRYEGEMEAQGLLSQANLDSYESRIAGRNATMARRGGYLGFAGAVLSGAGDYLKTTRKQEKPRPSLYPG